MLFRDDGTEYSAVETELFYLLRKDPEGRDLSAAELTEMSENDYNNWRNNQK